MFRFTLIFGFAIIALSALLWGTGIVWAGVNGSTVTTCDDAHLTLALSGGGLVTFSCGPATLTVTSNKTISVSPADLALRVATRSGWLLQLDRVSAIYRHR